MNWGAGRHLGVDDRDVGTVGELGRRSPGSVLNRPTSREHDVLAVMAEGKPNLAIARTLLISQAAVGKFITVNFRKLAIAPASTEHRRVQAVLMSLREQRSGP
jgi:DNA-binding NarL/FixJ family response regulator